MLKLEHVVNACPVDTRAICVLYADFLEVRLSCSTLHNQTKLTDLVPRRRKLCHLSAAETHLR